MASKEQWKRAEARGLLVRRPSMAVIKEWMESSGAEATDGCWVEPDGTCPHGCQSWLIVLGLI